MALLRLIELEQHASCYIRFQFKMFYITLTVVKHRAVRQCAANSDFYLRCRTDLQKGREKGEQGGVVMNCWGAVCRRLGNTAERLLPNVSLWAVSPLDAPNRLC